ncbi:DUF4232 domain-containing protein [Streptomyces kunmingensis]|uniref:DUF4232 domain-containing protein n=1 Tax=Streptomyces kunmingensis TaxID=68225 RepID=A0ABU6CM49_9ACTN|nr:DUF4232 domain-containing protein [Streptomyces kunmingensis]MEB3965815.1 DUF4232 domain-containing protein [Streptomyces kunmingensis]
MRAHKLTLAGLALVAGLSLTACQGGDDSAASGNDSGSTASGSSSSSEGSGSQDSGSGNTGGSASGSGAATTTDSAEGSGGGQITTGNCKTSNLAVSGTHGMGEGTFTVAFKNTGGDACTLKGFPGVDLKVDDGKGAINAGRSKLAAPAVALKSGEETRFTLHYPRNDTGGSGVDITRLVVTPPNETHSKTLTVAINLPASDSPSDAGVTVDPVGTGKQ